LHAADAFGALHAADAFGALHAADAFGWPALEIRAGLYLQPLPEFCRTPRFGDARAIAAFF
jgi:hypothetical protein